MAVLFSLTKADEDYLDPEFKTLQKKKRELTYYSITVDAV
jgi:hypothetical protein